MKHSREAGLPNVKTRSKIKKSKYMIGRCDNCIDKTVNNLCFKCKQQYNTAKSIASRKKRENESSNSKNMRNCREAEAVVVPSNQKKLESSVPIKTNSLGYENMRSKVEKTKKSVSKFKSQKHQTNTSNKSITTNGNDNIHETENIEIIKQSDKNIGLKPVKKLSPKTLQNKRSRINKILGNEPVHRKQILECFLTSLSAYYNLV